MAAASGVAIGAGLSRARIGRRLLATPRRRVGSGHPGVASPLMMARSTAGLLAAGGVIALIGTGPGHSAGMQVLVIQLLAWVAITGGAAVWQARHHLPRWSYHLTLLAGTVMITVATAVSGGVTSAALYASLYLLVAVEAFVFFFRWPGALVQLGVAVLGAQVALEAVGVPFAIRGVPVALTAAVAVAVGWLARRVDDAETDGLIGLANRRGFDVALQEHLLDPARDDRPLALALHDLDHFKAVNDRVSHGGLSPAADPAAADLARGLRAGELFVVYQPLVDLTSEQTVGVEALVRWRHPIRGLVGPEEFIPVAEGGDLIHAIGRFVLAEAVAQGVRWRERQGLVLEIGVNAAGGELARPDYAAQVLQLLTDNGLPASQLTVEVTERTLDADSPQVLRTLQLLRAAGVRVSLDDFGTGYSSLSRLDHLPVDVLKVDQSFIRPLRRGADTAVLAAVVALGTALGLDVVGEGVETAEQAMILFRLGCGLAQGYHFGRPTEAADDAPPARRDCPVLGSRLSPGSPVSPETRKSPGSSGPRRTQPAPTPPTRSPRAATTGIRPRGSPRWRPSSQTWNAAATRALRVSSRARERSWWRIRDRP